MWILDERGEEGPKIIKKEITYVPGLYKIFDEILGKIQTDSFERVLYRYLLYRI